MTRLALRLIWSLAGIALLTAVVHRVIPSNPTTVGFAYLLLLLIIASTWGFVEACVSSIAATLAFNFFFLPPVGTFTIADPQNWVNLFSFLLTSLIASRLSDKAKRRAQDAIERQQDIERLYTFSRAILLIEDAAAFPKQLIQKMADIFNLTAVVLYDRRTDETYSSGPGDFSASPQKGSAPVHEQLREAALQGTSFVDEAQGTVITAVRLGSQPIASLAMQGTRMPDAVVQGIGNLVAIGLERAKAQDLAHQIEAARQSEELRTTLMDAMAHEFKTPLTSIKAATTSLLDDPAQPVETRTELLHVADEEADHLKELIDNALEMARLDIAQIDIQKIPSDPQRILKKVLASMHSELDDRKITVEYQGNLSPIALDERLVRLALKQLISNSLKYSPPDSAVRIVLAQHDGQFNIDVIDHGAGIPAGEQSKIFERFYRSPSVRHQVPGSGLGLSIAYRIARAHQGDLTVSSHSEETIFRMILPVVPIPADDLPVTAPEASVSVTSSGEGMS